MTITIPTALVGLGIRKAYEHETRCGVAYAADLTRNGQPLGRIENDGNGGGTWFYQADREALDLWNAACAEFEPQAKAMFTRDTAEHGLPPLDAPLDASLVSEYLADVLFDLAARA